MVSWICTKVDEGYRKMVELHLVVDRCQPSNQHVFPLYDSVAMASPMSPTS